MPLFPVRPLLIFKAGLEPVKSVPMRHYSVTVYPISIVIVIAGGCAMGLTTLNGTLAALLPAFTAGFAAQLVPRLIFALCEEWGWRGYLEPRLSALVPKDLPRHLLVGLIWALWHFPLILSTDYTSIPLGFFLPIFVVGVTVTAVVYGQMRKASGTVWTSVLMHGVGNAFVWAIIQNNLITINNKLLANISPEGIIMMVSFGLIGSWLFLRKPRV